jgi:hypothetical protein
MAINGRENASYPMGYAHRHRCNYVLAVVRDGAAVTSPKHPATAG